ncbi:hypothetical protein A1Q2_01246 [Trichosporon asahii var. asahii CBS 8904]|uniref:Uncharacterized protein n=1 Tax=Trichosporon asahii var. asahii (strain CBS 8904) TaxID=1220162 RepID=K1VJY4_TRIAC|nr:hypothetical protein A1Q2_01246 [Trichosporon asahii var. asahii CBS 8904]
MLRNHPALPGRRSSLPNAPDSGGEAASPRKSLTTIEEEKAAEAQRKSEEKRKSEEQKAEERGRQELGLPEGSSLPILDAERKNRLSLSSLKSVDKNILKK